MTIAHDTDPVSQAPFLTAAGCRSRQKRLQSFLRQYNLAGALLTEPRHVHYFSGFWHHWAFPAALWIGSDGEAVLSWAGPQEGHLPMELAVDRCVEYTAHKMGTLVEDPAGEAAAALSAYFGGQAIGLDRGPAPRPDGALDLTAALLELRRTKDGDEVSMLRHAIRGAIAAYEVGREMARPGTLETELFAAMYAAASRELAEPIGEMGNNFQANASGATPRRRQLERGELLALDVSVAYRGYRCDLCRTYCVGEPTALQRRAQALVLEQLGHFEKHARPGASCKALYESARDALHGTNGWSFPHHLGHGIGLSSHEAPRINPHWDDVLRVGDVVAVEPGLYGDTDLKNGVRIEDDYLVTAAGVERLSNFSREF